MKKFLKENWFKLVISSAGLISALAVGYYFMIFLPQKYGEETEQEKQEKIAKTEQECREIGQRIYTEERSRYKGTDSYAFEPVYKFNQGLNKCLYSGGYYLGNYWERWVKDVTTNEKLIFTFNPDVTRNLDEALSKDIDKYWEEHESLFEF